MDLTEFNKYIREEEGEKIDNLSTDHVMSVTLLFLQITIDVIVALTFISADLNI